MSASRPSPALRRDGDDGRAFEERAGERARATSSAVTATRSGATRSIFVTATTPRAIPSSRTISKCSRVCGITDSSAATTSSTASIPPAPASMLRTNRSCPGTSTNETRTLLPLRVREAEVDRDAAPLLFGQTVRVDARSAP